MSRVVALAACLLAVSVSALAGCGDDAQAGRTAAGVYVLDRSDYVRALVAAHPPAGGAPSEAGKAANAVLEAARKAAGSVRLRLDLAADGTFFVAWQFPAERGRRRGAWTQAGETLTLRITHDPAGQVERGAVVTATHGLAGIRFSGWPVPNAFLLRRK